MYSKEQLEKGFKKIIDFYQIPANLIQVMPAGKDAFTFFIEKTREVVDTEKIASSLSEQMGITAEVVFMRDRDKAQQIGGCGPCGLELCCASWLKNIPPVSNESLKGKDFSDPSEYLGMCGKLRCCLAFQDKDFKLPSQPYEKKSDGQEKKEQKLEAKEVPKAKPKKKMIRKLTIKKKSRK